jgi:hypothetical protein
MRSCINVDLYACVYVPLPVCFPTASIAVESKSELALRLSPFYTFSRGQLRIHDPSDQSERSKRKQSKIAQI